MKTAAEGVYYDVIFLDVKLPPSSDGKILSGEELGIEAKTILPYSKIVILTMFNDNFRLNNILKNVDPDGFLIKTDVTSQELVNAFEAVLNKPPYYSNTINQLLRKQITNDIILDNIDRKILYQISIGTKVKDIPNFVTVSIGSVERRKRQLKKLFKVADEDDRALIEKAKTKGFI
jgi:DNA-binding NarL/FixJ family response regulator